MKTTSHKKTIKCCAWMIIFITGFMMESCSSRNSSLLQSQPISLEDQIPLKFLGVEADGSECSYSMKFTEDGKSIEIQAEANDLRAYVSIPKTDIPLVDGYKKDLSVQRQKINVFYKGNKFNWDARGTTDFLEHNWLDLQIDKQLLQPVEFAIGVGFGPLPSITKGKCTKLSKVDNK